MLKKLLLFSFLLIVACSCPNESLEWQTNCFFFQNNLTGFAAAEVSCVKNGGHLVSIHDAFTNALLAQESLNYFHESTMNDLWIGLTDMTPPGNWSWIDGSSLDFKDWANSEPKNVTGSNCVTLSVNDARWKSDDCFKSKPYICQVDKNLFNPTTKTTKWPVYANCTHPYTYFEPTHSCYGVIHWTGSVNWTQGEEYCETWGGHLTSIHDILEARFIGALVNMANADWWTGAFSNDGGRTWEWSDRTPWDFTRWDTDCPKLRTSACGVISGGGGIRDELCNKADTFRFICKNKF